MIPLDQDLGERLEVLSTSGLRRSLRILDSPQGRTIRFKNRDLLNFSSNDYLGLANDPLVNAASVAAIQQFGSGSGASRLICGSLSPHHDLESCLAKFKQTDSALVFSSGYLAALGVITALLERQDVIIIDKWVHACVVDAARYSPATLRVFPHNDLEDLERLLKWAAEKRATSPCRILVVTESVFSMDGDLAPLSEIVALKERYEAWLMVDEAHATGLMGPRHAGLISALGLASQVEIQMGTLGKALGSAGGFIAGSRTLVDFLINRARSFIFSTAPTPAASAAALTAIQFLDTPAGRQRVEALHSNIMALTGRDSDLSPAIFPIHVGDETRAVEVANLLLDHGFFIPGIRYPTVSRGAARLRLTLSAAHTQEDIRRVCEALAELGLPLPGSPAR